MSSLNDSFSQPSLPKLATDQVFHDLNRITSDDKPFRRYRYESITGIFSKRKFASGTFIWSIKQSTAAAPPVQPQSLDDSLSQTTSLDPNSHLSPLERNDEQREVERVDGTAEKPNRGLQTNSPRSIIPDTLKEVPTWYNKNTWASAPLPSLSMRYQIHNPVGPRWYSNHHLIPPSLRHPSARPPSIFSPSFPPMSTATLREHSEDSTHLSMLSRTPSNTPLPTPSSTQPGPFDSAGRPRSRKTSQTAHDDVDLLDATDPSGTNWHHQSPYDCGLVSSDKHELLTRPRRLSTTNLQTKRKPAPSPLSQSTSATHLPSHASYSIQAPRKLSKRRTPLSGGLFGQSHDRLTTSAPATPVDGNSIIPGPPPQNALTRQTSAEPASSQSQTSKRERRGSFLTRLAKKFSLIRSSPNEPEVVSAEMEWQQSNYSNPSGEVNVHGYSHGHNYDAAPPPAHPSPSKAPIEPPRHTPPTSDEPTTTSGKDRNYEADKASAISIEAPYSIGKLKVANPDVPTPEQNSPHPSEAPSPPERSNWPAHERHPSVISAIPTNPPTQLLSPLSTVGGLPESLIGSRIFTAAPDSSLQRPLSHSRLDSSSRAAPSPTDDSMPLTRESSEREWAPSRPTSHREDRMDNKPLPRVEGGETSLRLSFGPKETAPSKAVPSRADPPVSGKRISGDLEPKLAHPPGQKEAVATSSRRGESSPQKSAARGEEVSKITYMPSTNGSSGVKDGDFTSSALASLTPWWSNFASPPPLPSKSPATRDKRISSTARTSSYLTAPTPVTTRPTSSQDRHITPKHEAPTPTVDQSPLSISSLLVNPPTPYIPSDRQISTTPEPNPPTVPPKSPRLPKHLRRESISQRSRQTETFRLIRSSSGRVDASGETIVAAGEQWEVVESVANAKSKNRNSFRPQEASSSSRKEVSQRPEKSNESTPSRNHEHRDRARSERSRRQVSEPGSIPTPVMTAQTSQPQAKPTSHKRAPSLEPSSSSRNDKHGRQEESKHSRRESSDHKKGSSESRRRRSPPNGQVNVVPFNVNKPQPVPPPTVNPGPTPQPRPLERAPSTNRPTSELPSAELNAVRAKEAWEMERLWKAKTMYGVDPDNAPAAYSVPSEKSSSAGRESHHHHHHHQHDPGHHGSSHTSFTVSGTFQKQPPPSQIYHSMPLSPPPIIYQGPPSHPSSHRSSTPAVHPTPTGHRHGHSHSHSHSHPSGHRPVIAVATTPSAGTITTSSRPYSTARTPLNPLPEPPREATYEFPSRSSKQFSGITLAH